VLCVYSVPIDKTQCMSYCLEAYLLGNYEFLFCTKTTLSLSLSLSLSMCKFYARENGRMRERERLKFLSFFPFCMQEKKGKAVRKWEFSSGM
jgi:hypothetical protein